MSDFFEFSLLTVWSVNVFVEVNLSVPRERCSSVRVSGFQSPCPTGWDAPWLNYNNVGGSSFFVYMENIIGSAAACVQYFMAQFLQNWWRTSRLPPHRREHVAVFHWVIKYCSELWGSLRCIDTTVCFVLSEPGMSWREWGKKKKHQTKEVIIPERPADQRPVGLNQRRHWDARINSGLWWHEKSPEVKPRRLDSAPEWPAVG